jgi:hypothetical protein
MNDAVTDELGPIDWVIVEFPGGKSDLKGAFALELASLADAELVRVLDLVVIDKGKDGHVDVREFEDLERAGALGDLRTLAGQLAHLLTLEDIELVVDIIDDDATAVVLVWENTWAGPFAGAARRSGGHLVGSGRVATETFIESLQPRAPVAGRREAAVHVTLRPQRMGRSGVIRRPVGRSTAGSLSPAALAPSVRRRNGEVGSRSAPSAPSGHDTPQGTSPDQGDA